MALQEFREIAAQIPRCDRGSFDRRCVFLVQDRHPGDRGRDAGLKFDRIEQLRRCAGGCEQGESIAQYVIEQLIAAGGHH
jgi:hypothetical protein